MFGVTNSFLQPRGTEIPFFVLSFWTERSAQSFTKAPDSSRKGLKGKIKQQTLSTVSFAIKSHGLAAWGEMKWYEVKKKGFSLQQLK